jgi:glycosyltransferase involved in cell wall biosynthesis
MKIAFLNKYQNKVARGAETFVYELSRRLSKHHKVDIISKINYLDLLKCKYDLIIPTNGRIQVIVTRIISWLSGSKMVVSGQSGIGWDDKVNILSFPDTFIALTDKAEKWAKRFNPLVRIEKISNGVDLKKFKPLGELYEVNLKKPIILAVGAFTDQKRLEFAIAAVAKLKDVSLLLVGGGGNLKDQLEVHGKKLLGDRFQLLSVPFDEMPKVYRTADVFTLPSESSESFGNVLIEAMATGLPVVATNDSIREEIVGEAGILVDPKNVDKYAEALQKALNTNWGEKPRKQAEKFSWDKIAEKYEKLFETLKK